MLREISQAQKVQMLYESTYVRNVTKVVTSVEPERTVGARGWWTGKWGVAVYRGLSFGFAR